MRILIYVLLILVVNVSNELNQNKCRLSAKKFCLAQNLLSNYARPYTETLNK